jgi:mRNA interferase MazF
MRRGEVWLINLDPTIGSEIRKIRPVVIVSDDEVGFLPLKIIVPLTDWKDRYLEVIWMTKIQPDRENGLTKTSAADAFQVRSVSQERFIRKIGRISPDLLHEVTEALAVVLSI